MIREEIRQRVFITGVGAICSVGNNFDDIKSALKQGFSGTRKITAFDTEDMGSVNGCEVKNFNPFDYFSKKDLKRMDRASQLCLVAAREAISSSDLNMQMINGTRCGVSLGTLLGGIISGSKYYKKQTQENCIYASQLLDFPLYSAGSRVCTEYGIRGPNIVISTACSASNVAIGYAYDLIQNGIVDIMIVGGFESMSEMTCAGFGVLRNLSPDICQPFDKNRKGIVLGEGAAIMILESEEHFIRRSGRVYAEFMGYGMSSDAYHMTAPDITGKGPAMAMKKAIENSRIGTGDIDYINAHGTGTHYNDLIETSSIKRVFGEQAYKIPISSTKSMHGHTLGAAGAIEAITSIAAIKGFFIPPTINYEMPDTKCDLDYVPNQSRDKSVNMILSNGFGFGGNNCSIVIRRFNE